MLYIQVVCGLIDGPSDLLNGPSSTAFYDEGSVLQLVSRAYNNLQYLQYASSGEKRVKFLFLHPEGVTCCVSIYIL